MASQTPPPASMTANPGRPSRLRVRLRRWRFALRRDPLATVTSPAVAIHLADELLARTAIARPDTKSGPVWLCARWRHSWTARRRPAPAAESDGCARPFRGIEGTDPDDAICDDAQAACNRPAGSVQLRTALPWLRGLEPRQRDSVTLVMRDAVAGPALIPTHRRNPGL